MKQTRLTRKNCRLLLAGFIEQENITSPDVARAIGCSHATLGRILSGKTLPTDEFMKQSGILIGIGYGRYKKLSDSEKEKVSETIGTAGSGTLGFGMISGAVSASGTVTGLSAAGITSGLASLGGIVGGGMVAGVALTAAIPITAGALGYGIIKGVKYFFSESELRNEKLNPFWEQ